MELISVIVPVYKVEDFLNKCVESIVNQTYSNLEIILVDDGSPDGCPKMCDEWAKKDSRIKVIHKVNGGLSSARNAGVEIAEGKYIGFVDGDDWIEPTMYQNLYDACIKYKAEISCCGRYLSDGEKITGKRFCSEEISLTVEKALNEVFISGKMDVAAWDKLYLKVLFEDIRYPIGEINEDLAIFYYLFDKANCIVHTGTVEYYYRCRKGSITQSSYRSNDTRNILKHLSDLEIFINSNYSAILDGFMQYKAINIYYIANRYIKSAKNIKSEEYRNIYTELKAVQKYVYNSSALSFKDKMIMALISLGIYNNFLKVKALIKGYI